MLKKNLQIYIYTPNPPPHSIVALSHLLTSSIRPPIAASSSSSSSSTHWMLINGDNIYETPKVLSFIVSWRPFALLQFVFQRSIDVKV